MSRRRILVTDGQERAALALVRAYGRAGHEVIVAASDRRSLAGASRYAAASEVLPDPLAEGAAFREEVVAAVRRRRCDVVIPTSEASLYGVLGARDRLAGVLVPFADLERFRRLSDKAEVMALAPRHGIAVPRQAMVEGPGQDVAGDLRYPVVVKPARSVAPGPGGSRKFGVAYADDRTALRAVLSSLPEAAFPVLLQERIVGPGVGVFCLLWGGELRAVFAHRRIREKPPSGGVSVYRESAALDPELLERSVGLLRAFDWTGVAMVEYKLDAASGTPYIMEINGRFWGSLQLAIDAGVDFPNLLLRAALGEATGPPPVWRVGVRSRWWWGDVDHLLTRLFGPREVQPVPSIGGRGRALVEFLKLWRPGDRSEVWRLSDPAPFLRETVDWVGAALR